MNDYHNDPDDSKQDMDQTLKIFKRFCAAAVAVGTVGAVIGVGYALKNDSTASQEAPKDKAPAKVQTITPKQDL